MKYDISKPSAPPMPTLGKGAKCVKLLLSQTSKDMHEPLVPMLFPLLGAHVSGSEILHPNLNWQVFCVKMAILDAKSMGMMSKLLTPN